MACKTFNSDLLLEKQAETAQIIEEYKRAENELTEKMKKLKELMAKAEKIAPSEEWRERLQQDDVPTTLEEVESEMDEAELKVVSLFFFNSKTSLLTHSYSTLISCCVAQLDRRQPSRHPRIREKEARDPRVPG
jgi:lambda repressor-like predicted transcriptional regulator